MEVILGLCLGLVVLLIFWLRRQQSYWRRRGIPHNKPALLGSTKCGHITEIFQQTYQQYKGTGPFAGLFFLILKCVLVIDLNLIKNVLIRDFNTFPDRGLYSNAHDDPITSNIFFSDFEEWKRLRTKITPIFTSGKMKNMFHIMVAISEQLVMIINERIGSDANARVFEMMDLLSRYTADIIGNVAFGIECNSLRNEIADFVVVTQSFLTKRRHNLLIEGFIYSYPKLARRFRTRLTPQRVHDFYMNLVRETIAFRQRTKQRRNDLMDLLIDMLESPDGTSKESDTLTLGEIAGQSFIMFLGGYETSSTTMGFALYHLAQNEDVQTRLRQEIVEVLAQHKGELTYDSMKPMSYMEQVLCETLRMHPIIPNLMRKARALYDTGNPKYYIEKGTLLIIPIMAIHYDPEYYPEPHKFDPERFTPEEIQKRPACSYLPFGEGPRNCMGMRFGKMQSSIGLIQLLKHFKFSVAPETEKPQLPRNYHLLASANGIKLRVERI